MKLFSVKEAQNAKREQDREQLDKEQTLVKRVTELQNAFKKELASQSEYREQMNAALEEEMTAKKSEIIAVQNDILLLKRQREELKKPFDQEADALKKERLEVEAIKAQLSQEWRDLEAQKDYYDDQLKKIGHVTDLQAEKELALENKAKNLVKQSQLIQSEMTKLENMKGSFEEEVAKVRNELDFKEKRLLQKERDNETYRKEIADREFQVKNKERSLIDREQRINYYEKSSTN